MSNEQRSKPQVLLPLISFGVILLIAMVVLVATVVIALAELLPHTWIAALIVAGLLFVAAWIIYITWLKATIDYLDQRLETVYDVASAARNGFNVARSIALRILDIFVKG